MHDHIEHKGVVNEVNDKYISVNFTHVSACGECHAKSMCNFSSQEDKIYTFENNSEKFIPGEEVKIIMVASNGLKAVFYSYILPLIVLISTLAISFQLTQNEPMSGLIALFILIPYYLILYLFKHSIDRKFTFKVEK